MAQASSAQREPSMEEILASIRKIIEDSDTTRRADNTSNPPHDDDEPLVDVDAFRVEFGDLPDLYAAADVPAYAGGNLRVTPDDGGSLRPVYDEPHTRSFDVFSRQAPVDADQTMDAGFMAENSWPELEASLTDGVAKIDGRESLAPDGSSRNALLSDGAGKQVAAAFGELSQAFAASRQKSFDQLAEEMMRPMLQDWLDNNLPMLVEKLVREEIERIARGGSGR